MRTFAMLSDSSQNDTLPHTSGNCGGGRVRSRTQGRHPDAMLMCSGCPAKIFPLFSTDLLNWSTVLHELRPFHFFFLLVTPFSLSQRCSVHEREVTEWSINRVGGSGLQQMANKQQLKKAQRESLEGKRSQEQLPERKKDPCWVPYH